jgi:hypothetical protein
MMGPSVGGVGVGVGVVVTFLLMMTGVTKGYSSGIPPVNRRALAGLWKLTPSIVSMKEFTVHPRKPPQQQPEEGEVLLMLKEDGSFSRYDVLQGDDNDEDKDDEDKDDISLDVDVDQSWKRFRSSESTTATASTYTKPLFKGTWDYRDGELILAADREEQQQEPTKGLAHSPPTSSPTSRQTKNWFWKKGKDTILVGVVVATRQHHQQETAAQQQQSHQNHKQNHNLLVPMGSVQVGKFFYPKNHPSFFDQPIFQPKKSGTFQLKQVLGNRNLQAEAEQDAKNKIEKFRNTDFHNRKFFLTSSPIEPRRPKGNVRWSIKYNKYVGTYITCPCTHVKPHLCSYITSVCDTHSISYSSSSSSSAQTEDPPSSPQAQKAADAEKNRLITSIRVMKVQIHANNTFSTLAGLGDSTVLRGSFRVMGEQRDHVWMQSSRFGFGRSVSGSTFSEGNALGEETKSYWGKISYQGQDQDDDQQQSNRNNNDDKPIATTTTTTITNGTATEENDNDKPRRLEVKGTVMVGLGLEPQPVASFIMREADDDDFLDTDKDDDDDDDDDDEEDDNEPTPPDKDDKEDDLWTTNDAFQ